MRVVLDTNILVSGLLSPYGAPAEVVRLAADGAIQLAYDARVLVEYRDVLLRPRFRFDREHVEAILDQLEAAGCLVSTEPLGMRLPDPDDEAFLEVALAARVRCLITGNLKHYPPSRREGMLVMLPSEFLDLYRAERTI